MITFAKRNLLLFFRDKSAVFFSLLAVLIIIGLYALFLGDVWMEDMPEIKDAETLMDSWLIAGLMAVTTVTSTMGAFGIMVEDRAKKTNMDFYAAPVKRRSITGGYFASAYIIGIIMSLITFVFSELYILMNGGELLGAVSMFKVFLLILLSAATNTALVSFIVSFFYSQNAFAAASTIIGTLIGFITGIYLPIGTLPETVQFFIKIFPVSHAAVLFRQIIMEKPLNVSFSNIQADYVNQFKESMGVTYQFGGETLTPLLSILILTASAILFYGLTILNLSRKRK